MTVIEGDVFNKDCWWEGKVCAAGDGVKSLFKDETLRSGASAALDEASADGFPLLCVSKHTITEGSFGFFIGDGVSAIQDWSCLVHTRSVVSAKHTTYSLQ